MRVQFLSVPEFASVIGVSRITAYRHVESGKVPSVLVGRRRLIPVRYLETLESSAFTDSAAAKPLEES